MVVHVQVQGGSMEFISTEHIRGTRFKWLFSIIACLHYMLIEEIF